MCNSTTNLNLEELEGQSFSLPSKNKLVIRKTCILVEIRKFK